MPETRCPCCSDKVYADCCQPLLEGGMVASDPEALMRSRYTAFATGRLDYLRATWHPMTVPDLKDDEPSNWVSLEILETGLDDSGLHGEVEFIAKLINGDKIEVLHEVSEFEKINGRWLYHSGEFKNDSGAVRKLSMKEPCPCGSGERFKFCHFQKR